MPIAPKSLKFISRIDQTVETALRAAYHARAQSAVELDSRWRADVMRDIRRLGLPPALCNPPLVVSRFAWRLAAAAGVVALTLSVYLSVTGFNPVDEAAELFFNSPVEWTFAQTFGE